MMLKVKSYLRILLVCVMIAFICLFGYLMLQNLCAEIFIKWGWEKRSTMDNLFDDGFWASFLVLGLMIPIIEELIFRLVCCSCLRKTKMPVWGVILISAVIFMVYHNSWSQTIYQFLMGIWLAWVFLKTRQIGWTMLIHMINNSFIVAYTYLTGISDAVFSLNALNIIGALGTAIVTTVAVIFLIKKGIPSYEK